MGETFLQDRARGGPLRVAVVAPPWFEVPPAAYGGIEWLCYWLTDGLMRRGHDVTLIAAGRNHTGARFVQTYETPPTERLLDTLPDVVHAARAAAALDGLDLDIVHDHSFAGPLTARARDVPTVVTVHGPCGGELADYYRALAHTVHLVAISGSQRRAAPGLPWVATVHNAVRVDDYPYREDKEDFVLFLSRMSPEKGAHLAIEAAREAGARLILAGKCIERVEREYFEAEVCPRLGADAQWIGPADTEKKKDLLSRARCLLFPIRWEEPFGIVIAEALACGTPVVGLRRGAVEEVIEDGVSGFVCGSPSELAEAIKRVDLIDSRACRERARLFDDEKMVSRYEAVYREVSSPA